MRGGVTTFVSQGASVVIQLASTVILARLLKPADYGILAMVTAVTAFAGLFRDLGLSSAAIQKATLTQAQQSNLFWINIILGLALTGLLAAAAPLVAWAYGKPEVLWVTLALSSTFVIGSFSAQSGALLVREMRFGRQAIAGVSGALATLAVAVTLALYNKGHWSLVWGQIAGAAVTTTALLLLSPFRPGLPSRGTGLKTMLKFGANITGYDFVNYYARNLDNILIGRFYGSEALGFYNRAYSLLMFPINNLRGPLNAVGFPAMSRLHNQPEAFRIYYCRMTELLALISMPLSAFLFVNSSPIIVLLLGAKWEPVVPIFAVLAFVSFIQPVATLWGMVLISRGLARRYFHLGIVNTVVVVVGFLVGLSWGSVGVATAYALVTYLLAAPSMMWAFKDTPIRLIDFVKSVTMPAIASVVAAVACYVVGTLGRFQPTFAALTIQTGVFAVVYTCALLSSVGGRRALLSVGSIFMTMRHSKNADR